MVSGHCGVQVYSDRYGLTGKLDLLEIKPGSGQLTPRKAPHRALARRQLAGLPVLFNQPLHLAPTNSLGYIITAGNPSEPEQEVCIMEKERNQSPGTPEYIWAILRGIRAVHAVTAVI